MTEKKQRGRAVTIRCVVCGLEVTGVEDETGLVKASDRSRPALGAPAKDGYCMTHAPRQG